MEAIDAQKWQQQSQPDQTPIKAIRHTLRDVSSMPFTKSMAQETCGLL
jgi:hypothetical protein